MEDVAAFVLNPFLTIDVEQVAATFQQVFALPSGVDMEMVDLQNDIELKVKSGTVTFGEFDPATQLSRLMQRNGLDQEQAEQRVAAQMPLNEKRGLAKHVIENSGSREDTHRQVLRLHTKLEDSMEFLLVRVLAMATAAGLGGALLYAAKLLAS
ncbi:Dephospho-CoA kinase domain-containing protein [Merluccius polli]|uniref:Dephospho-CoA kinase domain-containing protein n=1 Tax=Merluccius polli TaxID=89951 RepID=A0AA47LZX0_MERPO|nr:Dephospho-CoA kinase domain-containing protein [Merluccius polli]